MGKKFMTAFACVAMVLMGAVGLVACGAPAMKVEALAKGTEITFGAGDVKFSNKNDIKISRTKDNNGNEVYTVTGTASKMTDAQQTAFDDASVTQIVIVKLYVGDNFVSGTVVRDKTTNFTTANLDNAEGEKAYIYLLLDAEKKNNKTDYVVTLTNQAEGAEATTTTLTIAMTPTLEATQPAA